MEDKESTESGSLSGDPGIELPQVSSGGSDGGGGVVPRVMNMAVSMSMERNLGVAVGGGATVSGGGGSVGGGGGSSVDGMGKKKRGRPRKYDSDGNLTLPYIRAAAAAASKGGSAGKTPPGFSLSYPSSEFSSSKRGRGKSSGSGNWQLLASLGELFSNTAGGDFTPHVVTVHTGEDVAAKILTFAQRGPRGICVLSANGAVSNVTIRQPGSAGGILTYEGRFEILALTGSFTVSENGGVKSRTGGLSVSLAGPDGRVIGGGIAGLLLAASPIQIVVGTFMPNSHKAQKRKHNHGHQTSAVSSAALTAAEPISQAAPVAITYPNPSSQLQAQNNGDEHKTTDNIDKPKITAPEIADLNGSGPTSLDQRPSPDINLSVHVE